MKKNGRTILMLAALAAMGLCSIAFPAAQKQPQAEVALKAAMDKEIVDGDLNAAIAQYKKIIDTYSSNRTVAARALLRMGQCYEKLGNAEAIKAYEHIVQEYADQKDTAAEAQKCLATKAEQLESGITAQRIGSFSDGRAYTSLSRNGQLAAYSDNTGIFVQDLVRKEERRIVPKDSPQDVFTLNMSSEAV